VTRTAVQVLIVQALVIAALVWLGYAFS